MRAGIARIGLVLFAVTVATRGFGAPPAQPEEGRLKAHVMRLASPEFEGRRGEGAQKAADYLVHQFRALKLEPLFEGSYLQPIPASEPGQIQGRNVGARLLGSDPRLRDEWIIVSAHFDHLGVRNGVLYPGADDNASGVAMMLEVARSIAQAPERPRRSIMFLGFDLEEVGLFGSRYFVEHSPVPLERIALFITADMIGRSLGGVCNGHVFVMGTEHAPGLRPWIGQAAREQPVTVGMLGSDLLILNRSDYGPFRSRQVPYLFFSTGENPKYHTPADIPETLDYPKVEAISRVILGVVRQALSAEAVPAWNSTPEHSVDEAVTIRAVMRSLLDNREALKIGTAQMFLMRNTLRTLDGIVGRGAMTESERSGVIQVARIVLATVL